MSLPRLSRSGHSGPVAPVRLLHLGLGGFFRAHQASYTDRAPDADEWGIAAFGGRSGTELVRQLTDQEGLYSLVSRGPMRDETHVVSSVSRAHVASDHAAWLDYFRSPGLAAVTMTITEAGYRCGPDGHLIADDPGIHADLARLRDDLAADVTTAPARLVAGLVARARAGGGRVALVPCDNRAGNGAVLESVIGDFARLLDPAVAQDVTAGMSIVTTMVDRITPRTEAADVTGVAAASGYDDRCPVITEPFTDWVLSGEFSAGRPRWESAGATFTDDVTAYEHRKLWLLNGGHSLLAYLGPLRGHATVAEAISDDRCATWLQQWWGDAIPRLDQAVGDTAAYTGQLLERFANARIRHRLEQIAADGSQKLAIRIVPVVRDARATGQMPYGATRVLAGWVQHLRGAGAPVADVRAAELATLAAQPLRDAVPSLLEALDPSLGSDAALVAVVTEQYAEVAPSACSP